MKPANRQKMWIAKKAKNTDGGPKEELAADSAGVRTANNGFILATCPCVKSGLSPARRRTERSDVRQMPVIRLESGRTSAAPRPGDHAGVEGTERTESVIADRAMSVRKSGLSSATCPIFAL